MNNVSLHTFLLFTILLGVILLLFGVGADASAP